MKLNIHKIKLIMAERGLSVSAYSALCGISRQNVSTIMTRGTCEPRTAGKLAKGLGVSVCEIVKEE